MNELFVPYQQSLDMKELGFDEPCFGVYGYNKLSGSVPDELIDKKVLSYIQDIIEVEDFKLEFNDLKNSNIGDDISAPIFSQAFTWFREKYKYCSYVKEATKDKYRFYFDKFDDMGYTSEIYNSYPEAELECLIKLIELVKSGSLKA